VNALPVSTGVRNSM